jgi:hypothetical protein
MPVHFCILSILTSGFAFLAAKFLFALGM